ncbi:MULTISPECIES: DUF4292 domain-containing protein [Proteiniphilum]|jgi:hypothetical protein|uniref:DUF4292 domain-containing protein n=1 Tax=Proteiniphilum TaxID=294702 RepID=UPI001EE9B62E|nr:MULTISPECIES: DUF4292 domain-containing protein [Proteiniphilum]ULB35797.1 DUF4292 domain-containing protein [Proteiniphilum propionicum]
MNISHCKHIFLFFFLLGIALNSCKPKQQIVYSTSPVEDKSYNQLFNDIITSEFPYYTFSAKLNMNLTNGSRSLSSRGNIRIVKDNALQISIQPLFGVEMFRFYIDPDSVLVLDRMNKRYVQESISSLKEQYPVGFDFYTMQSVFTNALFVSGKKKVENSDYLNFKYIRTSDQYYYLTGKDRESGIDYSFTVNCDDRITFTHLMQPEKKHYLQWGYNNFAILNNITFPHKMNVTLSSSSRKVDAELLFSDIITNQPFQLGKSVPVGYNRTSIDAILKIISPNKD